MGKITILNETTKNPITLMGKMAGLCYGSNVEDDEKNYKRGLQCLLDGHGRVTEFPDVYMFLDGYSARVIREFYTHIGGSPTRLQESTRYINYSDFDYIIPKSIEKDWDTTRDVYVSTIDMIKDAVSTLIETYNIPKEDAAMLLPLGMATGVSCKMNSRTINSMSEQRKCTRAYWEFRLGIMQDLEKALREYSDEWNTYCDYIFKCKCEKKGFCEEKFTCGRYPKKE